MDENNAFGITGAGLNPIPAQLAAGCSASQLVASGSVASKLSEYFNLTCLDTPPVISADGATAFGNAGAGIVSGPGQVNFDFAFRKRTPFGSPEAKSVLETLAKGAPGARETEEAKESLERLAQRTPQGR